MKKSLLKDKLFNLFTRYLIIVLAALPNLWIFYAVFTPLTVYPVFFLLNLFFSASLLSKDIILVNQVPIEIIRACVAGSAYYLLLILNLSTPKIKLEKRINVLLFSFGSLLILNILRIFVLSVVYLQGYASLFDITHKLFWYLISIVFVVGIWFVCVKKFKIEEIPFYSDLKYLYSMSSIKKKHIKRKRSKRKH